MPFTNKPKTVLSRDDIMELIFKCFDKWGADSFKALETAALIAFLYKSGARISEALLVKRDDIKLDEKFLYLTIQSLKQGGGKKSQRVLPFRLYDDNDKNFFNELILRHAKKIEKGQKLWDFHRSTGWRRILELNKSLFLHLFRHSKATSLADHGVSDAQLRRWLGWSYTSKMPMNYTNLSKIHMIPISDVGDIDD